MTEGEGSCCHDDEYPTCDSEDGERENDELATKDRSKTSAYFLTYLHLVFNRLIIIIIIA